MGQYQDLQEIKNRVEAEGGVATFKMLDVRDAHGAGRLGVHVRSSISKSLLGMGLGHFPPELPDWQEDQVRIYKLGSPAADLIGAVLKPGSEGDELIRSAISGDAQGILDQVREIICP